MIMMKEPQTDRDRKRLEQNRKSARQSALKKKAYVAGLEAKVKEYEKTISQLREDLALLRK